MPEHTRSDSTRLPPFPPVVYVPALALPTDDQVWLDTRHTNDGRVALFVYSALDRLVEYYGTDTAWVLLTVKQLQGAYEQAPYDLLFLDQRVPWRTGSGPRL